MSTFETDIELTTISALALPEQARNWQKLRAVVDTGSAFSTIPAAVLNALGIEPDAHLRFQSATGAIDESDVGHALFRVAGREAISRVIFGKSGEPILLGAHTLESVLLGVDPVNEHLIPIVGRHYYRQLI
jgi:predicted aspartyl protease